MPAQSAGGVEIPSTPAALWCWLKGNDRGELFHRSLAIENLLAPAFVISDVIDSFQYDQNRDLSGYEDGTENPHGDDAVEAAIIQGYGEGVDGGSFVAVQQWHHDFHHLGLGTIIMEKLLELARKDQMHKIEHSIVSGNKPAIGLYKKFDFKIEGLSRESFIDTEGRYLDLVNVGLILE